MAHQRLRPTRRGPNPLRSPAPEPAAPLSASVGAPTVPGVGAPTVRAVAGRAKLASRRRPSREERSSASRIRRIALSVTALRLPQLRRPRAVVESVACAWVQHRCAGRRGSNVALKARHVGVLRAHGFPRDKHPEGDPAPAVGLEADPLIQSLSAQVRASGTTLLVVLLFLGATVDLGPRRGSSRRALVDKAVACMPLLALVTVAVPSTACVAFLVLIALLCDRALFDVSRGWGHVGEREARMAQQGSNKQRSHRTMVGRSRDAWLDRR